ncbi:MAG: RNA polymerase factor sigma-54 [Myxococcota bacterium]|nr:RNA polymerase factor sigma-54 [Myxococcota bacterium]
MELRPQLQQQQKLVMTLQMRQAIKLLQLNNQELIQSIEEELLSNPSLEEDAKIETMSEAEIARQQDLLQLQKELTEERNHTAESDTLWESLLENDQRDQSSVHNMRGGFIYNELPPIEANHSVSATLAEELLDQLRMEYCTEDERLAAEFIIGNLDHRGYLDCSYDEIQRILRIDMDDIEGAVLMIREFEPIGCGARSLEECLAFQAEIKYPEDPFFVPLIHNHLKFLQKRSYKKIAAAMDMDVEDVEEYHQMLKEFEPYPGRAYDSTPDQSIIPDIKIMQIDEEWRVLSNDDGIPRLRINQLFQKMKMHKEAHSSADKRFLEEKIKAAKFLMENIHKRERTIVRVMEAILVRQLEYFEYGPEYLRPMILRDVADDIGVHESTVSRITNGKYVETPRGVLELKYFFSSSISQVGGLDLASEAVKVKIKKLIAGESQKKPYSDNALVKLLAAGGIKIARRTVTKYREAMNIPSSRDRKA